MSNSDSASTTCAFIPVYCYYDEDRGGEIKTPILVMDPESFSLKAIILEVDPSIFTDDELKDQFVDAYRDLAAPNPDGSTMDYYDVFPHLVSVLHTDTEEISIYVCELYENTTSYFENANSSESIEPVAYKQGVDELIQGGALDPLTEKILIALSEDDHLTSNNDDDSSNSIELF